MSSDYLGYSWKSESRTCDDSRLLSPHIEQYAKMAHAYIEKISRLWNEIEYPIDERRGELDEIFQSVQHVWNHALNRAEKKKEERQRQIDEAVAEIYR